MNEDLKTKEDILDISQDSFCYPLINSEYLYPFLTTDAQVNRAIIMLCSSLAPKRMNHQIKEIGDEILINIPMLKNMAMALIDMGLKDPSYLENTVVNLLRSAFSLISGRRYDFPNSVFFYKEMVEKAPDKTKEDIKEMRSWMEPIISKQEEILKGDIE